MLEQAVADSPFLLEAAWLLVELYDKGGKYERGQEMLRKLMVYRLRKRFMTIFRHFLIQKI